MVPKLIHELVLGGAHKNTLRTLDKMIRAAVRIWYRLPKDTPLGYLHAPTIKGGLDIPCLEVSIGLLQKARYGKILASSNAIDRALVEQTSFAKILNRINLPCTVGRTSVTTKTEAKNQWTELLNQSVDGRELNCEDVDVASFRWLEKPERVFPRLHLQGIQLRGGLLPTKSRRSRGRRDPETNLSCRGSCGAVETLNHVLQRCGVTHDGRCARHNRVMRDVEKKLRRESRNSWLEPIIPAGQSFIKPDIVLLDEGKLTVLDIAVVAGNRMGDSWKLKCEKYGSQCNSVAIQKWAHTNVTVSHLPVIFSSRGLLYGPSGRGLRRKGMTDRDLMDLCLLVILGSLKCYDLYMRGT